MASGFDGMTMSEAGPTPASLKRVLAIFLPIACQAGEGWGGVVSFISLHAAARDWAVVYRRRGGVARRVGSLASLGGTRYVACSCVGQVFAHNDVDSPHTGVARPHGSCPGAGFAGRLHAGDCWQRALSPACWHVCRWPVARRGTAAHFRTAWPLCACRRWSWLGVPCGVRAWRRCGCCPGDCGHGCHGDLPIRVDVLSPC